MRRSREMIAIVVLASALAADGTLHAAPANQPCGAGTIAGTIAGRLVQRISAGLRRTINSNPFFDARSWRGIAVESSQTFARSQTDLPRTCDCSPNYLPLPPPAM